MESNQTLKIVRDAWGEIELSDSRTFKDVKLWPGGAREWNWAETGTRHSPGVQFTDVEECLEPQVKTIILSRGRMKRLKVKKELVQQLESDGYEVKVCSTEKAIAAYNDRVKSGTVAALIHSTC